MQVRGASFRWHARIRELLYADLAPEIFVLERVPGDLCWRCAEKVAVKMWRAWSLGNLPYTHPPQTKTSSPVIIARVDLRNVRAGG